MKPIKTILYACLFLFSFTFTAQSQEKGVSLDFDNYETNMEILANYVAAIKAGDANKLNSYLSDDALVLGLSGTSDTINKKVHLERYTLTFKENDFDIINPVYLSIQTNEKSAVGVGEYSFSWGTVSSTIKGTKKNATTSYHVAAQIVKGKIALLMHYYDTVPFLMKDGYSILPPKE